MIQSESPDNSGFFETPDTQVSQPEITFSHPEKVFRLTKVNQHRKWVVRKSLNIPFQTHPAWQACLRQEFETGYRLNHPNLIQYYHLEEQSQSLCLIREWVDGQTLAEWSMQPHTKKERIEVLRQLLEVTHYLHQHLLYHRDLSPYNVLITHRSRQVKVLDFGFAAMENDTPLADGTLEWSAPEQLKGACPAPSGDLYSIGRIAQLLFPDTQVPASVRKLINACLMTNPELRPATALQALQLLNISKRPRSLIWGLWLIVLLLAGLGIGRWLTLPEQPSTRDTGIVKSDRQPIQQNPKIQESLADEPISAKQSSTSGEILVSVDTSQFSLKLNPSLEQKAIKMVRALEACYSLCRDTLSSHNNNIGRYKSNCLACLKSCSSVANSYLMEQKENREITIGQHILFSRRYRELVQPVEDSIRKSIFTSKPGKLPLPE
jgi:serine/threonine protein kinase